MKREMVLFCRMTWMKRYQGVTDDDQPKRGGGYVDKHHNAGESDNFRPYNHVCRGYFRHRGEKLNLERISGEKRAPDQLDGVTVVWVATAPDWKQYIVGWYKNASVFRYYRTSLEATRNDGYPQEYWVTAKETDCVLIPEANRDFEIPNATRLGEGKGFIPKLNTLFQPVDNVVPRVIIIWILNINAGHLLFRNFDSSRILIAVHNAAHF